MKHILLTFLVFSNFISFGQDEHNCDTIVEVYFNVGKSEVSTIQATSIKEFLNDSDFSKCDNLKINLFGYTDIDGSENSNQKLARERIDAVEKILGEDVARAINTREVFAEHGERKSSKKLNRRVEIQFRNISIVSDSVITDSLFEDKQGPKVYIDSIITFLSGGECVVPKEIVQDLDKGIIKELKIKEITIDSFPDIGLTQDTKGRPLNSAGMFEFSFQSENENDSCLNHPVVFFFEKKPDECYECGDMKPWFIGSINGWQENADLFKISIVKKEGKEYYKAEVKCPGKLNMDCRLDYLPLKFKIKDVPDSVKIRRILLYNDCKTISLTGKIYGSKSNKVKLKVPCSYEKLKFIYEYETGSGKVYLSEPIQAGKMKKYILFRFCRVFNRATSKYKKQYNLNHRGGRKVLFKKGKRIN